METTHYCWKNQTSKTKRKIKIMLEKEKFYPPLVTAKYVKMIVGIAPTCS